MVWPEVIRNSAFEVLLLVICRTLSYIEYPVLSLVLLLQESRHITGRVSISAFKACGWVAHGDDLWGYVRQVEIVSILNISLPSATYLFTYQIHFFFL